MSQSGFQLTLSTLARIPNHSAGEVLLQGIDGISPEVRNGTIAALSRRRDEFSQRLMLNAIPQFSRQELDALEDLPRKLQTTLRKMIAEQNTDSAWTACHFILSHRAFDEFPAIVTAACDSSHPGADMMASTALELAQAMHKQIMQYRRSPSGRDPSFARRWALAALAKAVDRFHEHHRIELLEAFLLITTPGNHTLSQLLVKGGHPAHEAFVTLLRDSPSLGAIELLAKLFEDVQTPTPLLEIMAERTDDHFRGIFLQSFRYPVNNRVKENIQRLKRIPLLESPDESWFDLPAEAQAVAVEMVTASRLSRRTKLRIYDAVLQAGASLARMACCTAIGRIELPEARARLERLLKDDDPQVMAAAGRSLRRHGSQNAVAQLASLLEHGDDEVREAAKAGLSDFTFMRYVAQFDEMDSSTRRELGPIVRETDESATDQLKREIGAASLTRKLRGMQMAAAMGSVDDILSTVIKQTEHQDAAVRAEAVLTLARSKKDEAREATERATKDPNALVRNRAAQALRSWNASSESAGVTH